jgi:hypothetical protein
VGEGGEEVSPDDTAVVNFLKSLIGQIEMGEIKLISFDGSNEHDVISKPVQGSRYLTYTTGPFRGRMSLTWGEAGE